MAWAAIHIEGFLLAIHWRVAAPLKTGRAPPQIVIRPTAAPRATSSSSSDQQLTQWPAAHSVTTSSAPTTDTSQRRSFHRVTFLLPTGRTGYHVAEVYSSYLHLTLLYIDWIWMLIFFSPVECRLSVQQLRLLHICHSVHSSYSLLASRYFN